MLNMSKINFENTKAIFKRVFLFITLNITFVSLGLCKSLSVTDKKVVLTALKNIFEFILVNFWLVFTVSCSSTENSRWIFLELFFNLLSANPTKWSNTFKQLVVKNRWIVFSVFDHFMGLALKGLKNTLTLSCILLKSCMHAFEILRWVLQDI